MKSARGTAVIKGIRGRKMQVHERGTVKMKIDAPGFDDLKLAVGRATRDISDGEIIGIRHMEDGSIQSDAIRFFDGISIIDFHKETQRLKNIMVRMEKLFRRYGGQTRF